MVQTEHIQGSENESEQESEHLGNLDGNADGVSFK